MRNQKAFTFIEVCVVIAILSLITLLSVPTLSSWWQTHQFNRSVNQFAWLLNQARSISDQKETATTVYLNFDQHQAFLKVAGEVKETVQFHPAIQIISASTRFDFQSNHLPLKQEIQFLSNKGEVQTVLIEPFIKKIKIKKQS